MPFCCKISAIWLKDQFKEEPSKRLLNIKFILENKTWLDELYIKEAIKELSDREKKILSLRFMQGKTQMEVAKEVGISQAQVSRLEKNALKRIKGQ